MYVFIFPFFSSSTEQLGIAESITELIAGSFGDCLLF